MNPPTNGDYAAVEPFYEDEFVTILHGDCEDLLPALGDRADLAFADPPYNVGIRATGIEQSERYCEVARARLRQGAFDLGGVA